MQPKVLMFCSKPSREPLSTLPNPLYRLYPQHMPIRLGLVGWVKVCVEGIETTSITDGVEVLLNPPASEQRLCYNLVYKPDIDGMDPEQLEICLTQDAPRLVTSRKYKQDLDILLYDLILKANAKLAIPPSHGHLHKYFCWMRQQP
jgi:hypothetical protein